MLEPANTLRQTDRSLESYSKTWQKQENIYFYIIHVEQDSMNQPISSFLSVWPTDTLNAVIFNLGSKHFSRLNVVKYFLIYMRVTYIGVTLLLFF